MNLWIWKWVILFSASVWINLSRGDFSNNWFYDVYTGRHFNDLATSPGSDIIEKPVVLILYGSECLVEAVKLVNEARPWGPPDKYLTLALHDYSLYKQRIWYTVDTLDDLKERYMTAEDSCLLALHFPIGRRLSNPDRFHPSSDFYEWIWSHVLITVEVMNALINDVILRTEGQGDPVQRTTLQRYDSVKLSVHISMSLTVYWERDTRWEKVLYYHLIEPYSPLIRLTLTHELLEQFKQTFSSNWLNEWRHELDKESADVKTQQMNLAFRYHEIVHSPRTVERFSEKGYMQMMLPEKIFKTVKDYYNKYIESNPKVESTAGVSQFSQITLPEDVETPILDFISKIFEDWCHCDLIPSETLNILHYSVGDYISDHINHQTLFTALLQIQTSSLSWPVEIIDFTGQRNSFDLKDGEVLLYEAGSVVFARPNPYQGEAYVCLYVDLVEHKHTVLSDGLYNDAEVEQTDVNLLDSVDKHQSHIKEEL